MLSLLGSLLGFGTSFLPKVMDFFQDKQDKKHELALMVEQAKIQQQIGEQKLQMVNVEADIRGQESLLKHDSKIVSKAAQWVINLSATVRPMVAYLLFIEFFVLTWLLAFSKISLEFYQGIWNEPMQAVFATVVSFYFGSRSFNRKSHS